MTVYDLIKLLEECCPYASVAVLSPSTGTASPNLIANRMPDGSIVLYGYRLVGAVGVAGERDAGKNPGEYTPSSCESCGRNHVENAIYAPDDQARERSHRRRTDAMAGDIARP